MGMKYTLLAFLFLATSSWAHSGAPRFKATRQFARGRILIEPRAGVSDADLEKTLAKVKGRSRKLGKGRLKMVDLSTQGSEEAAVAALAKNPNIKYAELDRQVEATFTPNDPYFSYQWHSTQVNLPTAWNTTQGAGITIAILDSGVDASHPDLAANLVSGFNVYDNNTDTSDVCGHGTAVAGTAAASSGNGLGVVGAAGQAKIMPVRVAYFDSVQNGCFAYYSTIASGITYAADHGARIVNCSYDTLPTSTAIQSAAQYLKSKGGLLFVSAGNRGIDEGLTPTDTMIVVSATDSTDMRASWSSYGNYVTISAPGNSILTTTMGNSYQYWSGTSFSSPLAAGVAALLMSARPTVPANIIEGFMYSTARDFGVAGRDPEYGYGRIDAAAAMQAVVNYNNVSDTQKPTALITAPVNGAAVSGVVTINANASDNIGVTKVELRVNNALIATDNSAPYSFSWDSKSLPNGSASLVVTAYDAAGNSTASSAVNVSINNDNTAPTVSITSPTANSKVSGVVTVNVSASDNVGVTKVEFKVNGAVFATGASAPFSFSWDSRTIGDSMVTLSATAYDAAGNSQTSVPVSVTVANSAPPADTQAPSITILSPVAGFSVADVVNVNMSASDNVGVTKVELKANGTLLATMTAPPYTYSWNTKSVANGAVSLTATAYDAAGNTKIATNSVTVANDLTAPTVSITSPTASAKVSGIVAVNASATDNVAVAKVVFSVKGVVAATVTSAPYSFNWDTKSVANGSAALIATAYDNAGNSKVSASVTVTVANDVTAPTVSLTSPTASATVAGLVTFTANASDAVGVTRVEFKVNGTLIGTDTTSPYSVAWDSKFVADGTISVVAVAYDAAGNSKTSTAVSMKVLNPTPDTVAPVVTIANPLAGSKVGLSVTVSAKITDNRALTGMTWTLAIDGAQVASGTGSSISYRWKTTTLAAGTHTVTIQAKDQAGNIGQSSVDVQK